MQARRVAILVLACWTWSCGGKQAPPSRPPQNAAASATACASCASSAARGSKPPELHKLGSDPQAAQETARERFQGKYGPACEQTVQSLQLKPSQLRVAPTDEKTCGPVMLAHLDEVRTCYEDARAGWPDLEGRLELQLAVGMDGRVAGSHILSSALAVPELACCVRQFVHDWTFPATPDGRSSIKCKLVFRP